MALVLAEPSGPVRTYASGLKVIRLADYPGPSRATLDVVTDAGSVAGDVVQETQTQPLPTTTPPTAFTLYADSADTIRIPKADIGWNTELRYMVFVGVRTTGEAPDNAADGRKVWRYTPAAKSVGLGIGLDDADYLERWDVPRNVFPEYRIIGGLQHVTSASYTDLVLRAWGIDGGTTVFSLDCLYAFPEARLSGTTWKANDFQRRRPVTWQALTFAANGVLTRDRDDDASSAPWLGSHSVIQTALHYASPGLGFEDLADLQDSDDEVAAYDITTLNWTGAGPFDADGVANPYSYLIAPYVGCVLSDPFTICADGFATNSPTASGTRFIRAPAPYRQIWDLNEGNFVGAYEAPSVRGWFTIGGVAVCKIPANQTFNPVESVKLGELSLISGESATNPSLRSPTIEGLWSCVQTVKFRFDQVLETAFRLGVRYVTQTSSAWCEAALDSGGGLTIQFTVMRNSFFPTVHHFDNETHVVTSGYSANDWYWLKVEKRAYHWRAKCWADGDAEPDWQIEGHEGIPWSNTAASIIGYLDHPYDASWVTGTLADHDTIHHDPRLESTTLPYFAANPGLSQLKHLTEADDYTLEFDPGEGTRAGMTIKFEKYDGTLSLGTKTIPYGPQRVLDCGLARRHFDTDTHGFNVRAWKDAGSPDMLVAGIGSMWEIRERNPPSGYVSFSALRWPDSPATSRLRPG